MAAMLCLGLVTACGSGGESSGYVNDGAAGPEQGAPSGPVSPEEDVRLIPLKTEPPLTDPEGLETSEAGANADGDAEEGEASGGADPKASEGVSEGGPSVTPSPGKSQGGPAKLSVGAHTRAAADDRWCERVTFPVHNTGGTAVTSGSVTFTTKATGALGTDRGTVQTRQNLRAPIGAGERESQSYTVCVDSWRVMLGGSVETLDVQVDWK